MPRDHEVSTLAQASREPGPLPRALAIAVDRALSALGADCPAPLSAGHRTGLMTRRAELAGALKPATGDEIRATIAGLSTMRAAVEEDAAAQDFVFAQFKAICADVPLWALQEAVLAYLRHEAGNGWRPTAGELRATAMRRVAALREEEARIERALTAKIAPAGKPLDPARRKELGAMLRQAAEGFSLREREAARR
jgi:hypothetical protein